MELRHLRYFVAVAEELNFSRAAERLRIAQPPLSQQIKDLEEYLGVKLIDRNERPVRLTEAGVELLEQSRVLFERLDDVVTNVRRIGKGQTGSIRVGFVGSATYEILPEIFRGFRKKYPQVELGLLELRALAVLEKIRHREIDIGFVRHFDNDETFISRKITEEPLVVALPASHPFAKKSEIKLSTLAGEPFIGFSAATTGYGGYLVQVCEEAGFRPNIVQETVEIQTAVSLISAGYGLTLAPESLRRVSRDGVVYRPLAAPAPLTYLFAVYRRQNQAPALQSFLGVMDKMLESQGKLRK